MLRLALPDDYEARWLSDPDSRAAIERWCSATPERCLYSSPAYTDFARAQNGLADLLWLLRDGNPVLGMPLHPVGDSRLRTGYSGLMFADSSLASVRRGVSALLALLELNRRIGFQVLQSPQAPAYDDPARITMLAFLLDQHGLRWPSLYSRVLDLQHLDCPGTAPDLRNELLLEEGLGPYEAELRNQIRQAVRRGLYATCALPRDDMAIEAAYRDFVPLHRESWQRTGMTPHERDYWFALAHSILAARGRDMIVYARDTDGTALAVATCHIRDNRALYWAGASSEQGLRSRANPLCLHAAIQACRQLGVRQLELGRFDARERSQKEQAVTRYKAQFGGTLVRVGGFRTEPPAMAVALRRARSLLARRPSAPWKANGQRD